MGGPGYEANLGDDVTNIPSLTFMVLLHSALIIKPWSHYILVTSRQLCYKRGGGGGGGGLGCTCKALYLVPTNSISILTFFFPLSCHVAGCIRQLGQLRQQLPVSFLSTWILLQVVQVPMPVWLQDLPSRQDVQLQGLHLCLCYQAILPSTPEI